MTIVSSIQGMRIASRDSSLSWITVAASVMVLLCSFGFLHGFGILYHAFLDEYQDSKEKTAWVGSIPMAMMCILAPIASWVLNRCSLRLCTALLAIPIGLSFLVTSYARNIDEVIAAFSIPFGITSCMFYMIGNKSLQVYFNKRMLTANGLMTGGCAVSQVGFAYIIITLLNSLGLEQTLRVLGGIMALICVVASQFYLPTSYEHNQQNSAASNKRGVLFYLKLLQNKQFAIFAFANFICCFAYGVSSVHQVQVALHYGVSESTARQFPVFTAISNALGRAFCGVTVDFKAFRFISFYTLALFLNGAVAIIGSFSSSSTHLIVYIWFFAFTDGVIQVCSASMVRETVGLDAFPEGFAIMLAADSISIMLGPPLLGFIVDQTSDYRSYFFVAGIPPLISAIIIFPLRFMKRSEEAKYDFAEQLLSMIDSNDSSRPKCSIGENFKIEFETSV